MLNTRPPGQATNAINRQIPQNLTMPGLQGGLGATGNNPGQGVFPTGSSLGGAGLGTGAPPSMLGSPPPSSAMAPGPQGGMPGGMGMQQPGMGQPGAPGTGMGMGMNAAPMGVGGMPGMGQPPTGLPGSPNLGGTGSPNPMSLGGLSGVQSGNADPQVMQMVNALANKSSPTPGY